MSATEPSSEPPLIPEQRRDRIVRHLRQDSVLSYRQLAALLGVSHMTVRRDIAELEEQGRVIATQGGAKSVARVATEPPRTEKSTTEVREKDAVAARAAGMVRESMTVYLDAGTTVQAMRPHLDHLHDLTIVTNDLVIAASYLDHPTIEVIVVGGRLDKQNQSTVGRLPSIVLAELSIDIAFLSTSSWDLRRGVTIPSESKVEPKQAAARAASTTVLVATSSKYGTFGRYRVMGLDALTTVVTDAGLPRAEADAVERDGGTTVLRVPIGPAGP
ncbi:DeoR family transcriptional regulator [Curtobacterium sp. MCBA15_009]|uniref:DeoR/GlpR family DNA-binding transcription regulator n=1 Tax=unclassified Curtobacterium TaxID=257496 RepID=UPI0008DDB8A5|nr:MULTISPECIES: DeoR/GlpR family DNA-binding transcription regulator [unclassified Curtobacterium]OII15259.1 DeoR family transcriptional regulator [Curtobacterium sp. MCBA15_009]WIE65616.1 DeoR/GlpR family DNA-binding transcription regulator [Curtobacterium sp. MCLR17_036]